MVVAAEFDALRDDSWEYVDHLKRDGVPVEFYIIPRAAHGFTGVGCRLTYWVEDRTVTYSFLWGVLSSGWGFSPSV